MQHRRATQIVAQQIGIALDDGEKVVEVVGDTARQPADRFHLLGLQEPLFQVAALRDIQDDAVHQRGFAA